MKRLDDVVINKILVGLALKHNVSVEVIRDVIEEHYKGVIYLIESGHPYQIKIDFFGKIEAKKTFAQIEEKIVKKFESLVPRQYEVIQNK